MTEGLPASKKSLLQGLIDPDTSQQELADVLGYVARSRPIWQT